MARPFSMSSLWHHVSIPAEVDGFLLPSPTWLPRFVHVFTLSLFSLSLSLSFSLLFLLSPSATVSLSPSLSLFSFFSPPQRRSLSLSFSLLFLLSPSATVSLATESRVSLAEAGLLPLYEPRCFHVTVPSSSMKQQAK